MSEVAGRERAMSEIREWSARGMTLSPGEHGLNPDQMIEFAERARDEYAGHQITVGEHGDLRVVDYGLQDGGPYLDWRD